MKIILNKVEDIDNWYTIIRAVHDGKEWIERTGPNSMSFRCSERLADDGSACIEGHAEEMLAIAKAIKEKSMTYFKRVAVIYHGDENGFYFWSPKNSREKVLISVEDSKGLMQQIFTQLGE